jgi:phosphoglycolate phosphatase-like HAD superfamily hydrolase
MIKTILWDFDGVIAESVNVKTEAFRELYIPFGKDVSDKVVEHHLAHGGVSRFEKFKIYHNDFLGVNISEEEVQKLAGQFSDLVMKKVIASPYIEGVKDFLENNNDKYQFYVISGTPDDEMKKIVIEKGLNHLFLEVMGSPKTKTQWINELVEDGKIEIETSVFIGDATTDYKAACNTGTKFVLREVDYNLKYFKDYKGIRVKDFREFNQVVENL